MVTFNPSLSSRPMMMLVPMAVVPSPFQVRPIAPKFGNRLKDTVVLSDVDDSLVDHKHPENTRALGCYLRGNPPAQTHLATSLNINTLRKHASDVGNLIVDRFYSLGGASLHRNVEKLPLEQFVQRDFTDATKDKSYMDWPVEKIHQALVGVLKREGNELSLADLPKNHPFHTYEHRYFWLPQPKTPFYVGLGNGQNALYAIPQGTQAASSSLLPTGKDALNGAETTFLKRLFHGVSESLGLDKGPIKPSVFEYPHGFNDVWGWIIGKKPHRVSKGTVLRHVAQTLPENTRQILTVGDNKNDLPMMLPNRLEICPDRIPNRAVLNYRGNPEVARRLHHAKLPGFLTLVDGQNLLDPDFKKAIVEKHGQDAIAPSIPEALERLGSRKS